MSNDKTLATAKHGGCVQLGDQAERARFEDWYVQNAFDYVANPIGSRDCALMRKAWQAALSAKPSPGSQGGALVDTARRNIRQFISKASFSSSVDKQAALSCVDVLEEALAARPPVGEPVAWVPAKFFDKGIVAMTARRTPPSAMAVELHGKYVPLFDAPPAQQPAQAVDLGQFREAVQEAYENADAGTLNKFSLEELLALIDGKAVGNG